MIVYRKERCIHQLFEAQVERTPDATAVVFEGKKLTYRELNGRANQLAYYLRGLGVEPEVLVGLCLERSLEMIVALLGILKAGGAYLPLDPDYPPERLSFMVEDAGVNIVLTQQETGACLGQSIPRIVCLDRELAAISREPLENPPLQNRPDSAAYVIYTSGSTGRPKGVVISHHNVVRLFLSTDEAFRFDQHDVWTLFHSYAFDFSVWEIWGALCHGARLVVVSYITSRSPALFYQLLCDEGVTVLNQTPSAFRQLVNYEAQRESNEGLSLRLVIFGGEMLNLPSLKPWVDRHGDKPQLVNMYGITETTVHVTLWPFGAQDVEQSASVIGRPLADLQAYILDQHGCPVAMGDEGELHIGGAGLARGYLNRTELTAEKFIPNPFSDSVGERLYKSGDLCRCRPDGNFEYLGRIDQQIKLRGFRIELGEIEAALARLTEVKESVVIAGHRGSGEKCLIAYVAADSVGREAVLRETLNRHLRAFLPEHMIPAHYVFLERLPLTTNGKIDRKMLPSAWAEELRAGASGIKRYDELTRTEELILRTWEEVIGTQITRLDCSFFEAGGDSIMIASVHRKLSDQLGVSLSIISLFKFPTVRSLAAFLDEREVADDLDKASHRAARMRQALAAKRNR